MNKATVPYVVALGDFLMARLLFLIGYVQEFEAQWVIRCFVFAIFPEYPLGLTVYLLLKDSLYLTMHNFIFDSKIL